MLSFLQYLFAYVIAASARGSADRINLPGIVAAILAYALAARIVGTLLGRVTSASDETSLRRLLLLSGVARIGAMVVFGAIAGPLGGTLLPRLLGVEHWMLVPGLLELLPYFALVTAYAWGFHAATTAMRVGAQTSLGAIADEFRDAIWPLAALVPLIVIEDIPRLLPPTSEAARIYSILRFHGSIQAFLMLGLVFLLLLATPFILRLVVRAKPMADGPLRRRLEAYAKRVGLRYRDIVVWPTGGRVLNAAVVGAFPRFRYVIITDGLLATLGEDEMEAVFAHEAGHARRGHILMFFGFTSVIVLMGFVPAIAAFLGAVPLPPLLQQLALLIVWLGVVFGWVSRRFEQEADVFGIETIPLTAEGAASADPAQHPFARAMTRIAAEAGAIREVTGWRHFSIDDRINFVRRYLTDERVRRDFHRSIVLLRGALLTVIIGFALVAAARLPQDIASAVQQFGTPPTPETNVLAALNVALQAPEGNPRAGFFLAAANEAMQLGRDDEAARWMREAAAMSDGPAHAIVLLGYASLLEKSGRPAGARLVWQELSESEHVSEASRELARRKAAEPGSR